jgi:DNA-binding SARP family transcriptional activator
MVIIMEFRVLGPVTAAHGGVAARIAPLPKRALALLLLRAGQPCPADWLTDALWDGMPPADRVTALRQVICRLRRSLGPAAASRLQTCGDGHRLDVLAGELDLASFRAFTSDGHAFAAQADQAGAERAFAASLALWTDPPLPGLPDSPAIIPYRLQLLDERRVAEDALMDARLALGQHQQITGQLRAAVAADPMREHAWAQLCTAYYRAGRKTDALAAAAEARSALARELGIGPGPELASVTSQILDDDPALADYAHGGGGMTALRSWRPVCQLPADLPGPWPPQADEVTASLTRPAPGPGITVVCGPAWRSARLAVHAAHLTRQAFPGGQLYAELTEGGQPREPSRVLAGLLASLGVPPGHIPADAPDRASMLRSLLAGRRVLVLAAGASDASQVLPLIPGTGRSAILITAEGHVSGLPAATTIDLDPGTGTGRQPAGPAACPPGTGPRRLAAAPA